MTFVPPVLAYTRDKDGKCALTADGKAPDALTEEAAKYIVAAYDKGKA